MFNVHQHWDPLRVCALGRSYPPEFYSWITVPRVRSLFERIAVETEEDFQKMIRVLQKFDVDIIRPNIAEHFVKPERFPAPPMTPRDYCIMIGSNFYECMSLDLPRSYRQCADPAWPAVQTWEDYHNLPAHILQELRQKHDVHDGGTWLERCWRPMFDRLQEQNVPMHNHYLNYDLNGAMVTRLGQDLYFGTNHHHKNDSDLQALIQSKFPSYRTHMVDTAGHSDGTYCPVCPGLIISLDSGPTYEETFPGWEVVQINNKNKHYPGLMPFLNLKMINRGRWWIPGFEHDPSVTQVVETWLDHWVGYVEETVFDVNMLVIDPKNVMVFGENDLVLEALSRYGITPHVVPFRHRYFWDGGIHCVTTDLHRDGVRQDWFPSRQDSGT